MIKFLKANWIFLAILAAAFGFRFWQIHALPGGLFPDEAANGLDVNSILHGHWQPFYERGNGREALFFYFLALSVSLFGRGAWQHHIVSAGFGFLEVFATYFLVKRLFNKNVALLATFFMAISSYAVTLSRTAFRANTIPLFTILTFLCLVKFFQTDDRKTKIWMSLGAGASFALGFYSYIAYRMMIPLLFGLLVIVLFAYRDRFKETVKNYQKYVYWFLGGFAAFFSWIGYYFITHPKAFVGRAGEVSIFSKDLNHGDVWGTFLTVLKQTLLSFFTTGDQNWRHNVSGFPFLSPFLSLFFAVSLVIFTWAFFKVLKEASQKRLEPKTFYKFLVAAWFWLMMVPEVTTAEGIPHGLRLVGVIPALFILPAWSIDWIWTKFKSWDFMYNAKYVIAIMFLGALLIYNFTLYFGVAAGSSGYYYAFRSDLTTVSNYLNTRDSKTSTYLALDEFSVQTVEYLTTTTRQPYQLLDPAHTYEVKLKKGDQVIFTQSTLFDRLKFLRYHPTAKLVRTDKNQFGELIMLVYQQL